MSVLDLDESGVNNHPLVRRSGRQCGAVVLFRIDELAWHLTFLYSFGSTVWTLETIFTARVAVSSFQSGSRMRRSWSRG